MSSTASFFQIDFSPFFSMHLFYFNLKCQYMRINAADKLMLIPKSRSWGRHIVLFTTFSIYALQISSCCLNTEKKSREASDPFKGRWNTRSVTWVYWAWLRLSSHAWQLTQLQISFFCLGGPQCASQQEEVSVCVKRAVISDKLYCLDHSITNVYHQAVAMQFFLGPLRQKES